MAAVGRAGSYSDFSSAGATNYIQQLYARQLLKNIIKNVGKYGFNQQIKRLSQLLLRKIENY